MSARDVFLKWFFNGVTPKSEEGVTVGNKKYDEFISTLSAAGYAVVPVEPTLEMIGAALEQADCYGDIYRAMITAAKETK